MAATCTSIWIFGLLFQNEVRSLVWTIFLFDRGSKREIKQLIYSNIDWSRSCSSKLYGYVLQPTTSKQLIRLKLNHFVFCNSDPFTASFKEVCYFRSSLPI